MGSRFQFELMTEQQARDLLGYGVNQAEFFADKVRAGRRLMPVTSPGEVDRNRAFLAEPKPTTFGCSKCWRFAFSERTLCFWCRKS